MKVIDMIGVSKEAQSVAALERTLRDHPVCLGFSAGKDSSTLANLLITAMRNLKAQGLEPHAVITHADTLVENPEIVQLARQEIRKIEEQARKDRLKLQVIIGTPPTSQAWPVRVIGGRALPPFPDTRRDCSTSWKIDVNESNLKIALGHLAKRCPGEPVVCTGVRLGESQERDAAIRGRGERSDRPFRNAEGRLMLSPILEWDIDDIWTYIGMCNAGVIPSYSDFEDTMRVYRSAGGTSCVVVSDMAMAKHSKPCSSRFGCWTCTAVSSDRSLTNMIDQEPERYGYMQPLAELRNFIADSQYDWDRRNFVQRTIKGGYITIAADTYSPAMLADLLRYTLTAQAESGVQIIDEATLVAIDARWSLYALHPPFEAVRIWIDVIERRRRYPAPVLKRPYPKTPQPVLGKVWVGRDWDDETSPMYADGLRHPIWELYSESCGPSLRTYNNGKVGLDLEEGVEVDPEGAAMFMEFEAHRKVSEPITRNTRWTTGYLYYLTLGCVTPAKGQSGTVDNLIRRANWRQDKELHGQRTRQELLAACTIREPQQADLFAA